ncbi:xanthine dehydrogenase family protein molybdopterin-binding subunit [Mariniphaga sp.]|uniref:xanthine dehydrogenase family protein molybdopterin-binding subunit n=1 Tax=Mariniphaga sp. TaxID=1954475 RepID=UPI003566FDD6
MKASQIDKFYFHDVDTPPKKFDRRDFIKNLGGGIFIVFSLSQMAFAKGFKYAQEDDLPEFNAFLRIKEDGRVDCYSGKIEMGQGINTSLAQALADELEVDVHQVDMIMGDTDLCPYDDGTWGSMTTRFHDPLIRAAAAEAREVLKKLASEKLEIPVEQLKATNGMIVAKSDDNKSISYAELTKGQKIVQAVSQKPILKKADQLNVVGNSFNRFDSVKKVTGAALYSADIRLPGLMFARILRPPAHGAKMVSVNTSAAEAMEGVKLLREEDFIAVLHASPEKAEKAVAAIKADWEVLSSKADNESIFEHILKTADSSRIRHENGDLETGRKESDLIFEHEYHDGYKAHASIETHVATAVYENGKVTLWASSQTPFGTRREVSEKLGLSLENVHLKQIFLGGGFGGKIYNRQAVEAARIAKMVEGTPVQLMWTRQEEFMYDMFRPAAVIKVNSGITKEGIIKYWDFNIYCAGDRGTDLFYGVSHHRTITLDGDGIHPFGTGAWRAPGNNTNTFARECQIDIMAHKIGMDPLEFRLKNMNNQRAINSLKIAADKFGWSKTKPPKGIGRGIAVGVDAGTLVTIIVEVTVDEKTGEVKVKRAVVGQDMGQVINPEGTKIQAEGCVNMGLGYSLTEDIEFDWGEVKSNNFGNYKIPLFSHIPESIETVWVDAMDEPPQGGGEPAIICMGGAVANAIFEACGARVFRLPVTPERILAALK